jgi:uncharacterized RDD family membrane protein YckC
MFCSKCGGQVPEAAGFCSACGAPVAGVAVAPAATPAVASGYVAAPVMPAAPTVAYAGFWLRFVAVIIDGVVLGLVRTIVMLPFAASFGLRSLMKGGFNSPEDLIPFFEMMLRVAAIGFVLNWLYYAFFESSAWQATLGKKALGLEVTDLEGRRISFGRASGRFFGKILSSAILLIGFLMAGFTEKKQALHDMIAGCLVLRRL